MIRRPATTSAGDEGWIFIAQGDHARLAGRCAELWGAAPYERLTPHAELVSAIHRHDDGWTQWEQTPQVDPDSGRPLDFMEMPLADSLDIWRRSIVSAATVGYLAGYVVSGHFSVLLRRFSSRWQSDPQHRRLATQFFDEQERLQAQWLVDWQSQDPVQHTSEAALCGLANLQFFDSLSLWLCCAQRTKAETMAPLVGPPLRLMPRDGNVIELAPWPFVVDELNLSLPGKLLSAANYPSPEALAQAAWQPVEVHWRLVPSIA